MPTPVIRAAYIAALLWLASPAFAGAIVAPDPLVPRLVAAAATNTDFVIDLVPDTQNQTNPGTVAGGDGVTPSEDDCSTATECTEPYCTHTIDCETSWNVEGQEVLAAQVALVKGEDPNDRRRASLVLHLGDAADWFDTDASKSRADACAVGTITAKHLGEWDTLETHLFAPLRASGIPSSVAHGNHDANGCYEQRVVTPWSALPFFHGSAVDAVHLDAATVWAIKAPTRVGSLCVLALPYQFYAETRDAAKTLSGCGASLPTIVVKHDVVQPDGATGAALAWSQTAAADDVVDRAGHAYVWMVVGGHYTSTVTPVKASYTGADSGAAIWRFFSDWQEIKHRGYGAASPYGVTPANGGDGMMTRILVSPSRGFLHAYDYNSVRHKKGSYSASSPTTELYAAFDWCARFGGC